MGWGTVKGWIYRESTLRQWLKKYGGGASTKAESAEHLQRDYGARIRTDAAVEELFADRLVTWLLRERSVRLSVRV